MEKKSIRGRLGIETAVVTLFIVICVLASLYFIGKQNPSYLKSPRLTTPTQSEKIAPLPSPNSEDSVVFEENVLHECPTFKEGRSSTIAVFLNKDEWLECPVCKQKIDERKKQDFQSVPDGILLSPHAQEETQVLIAYAEKKPLTRWGYARGIVAQDAELYRAQGEYLQARHLSRADPEADVAKKLTESAVLKLTLLGLDPRVIEKIALQRAPDKSLIYLEDSGPAWIYADILKNDIQRVNVADKIEIDVAANSILEAEIWSMDSAATSTDATVKVRARILDHRNLLKAGQTVAVRFRVGLGDHLVIPKTSVAISDTRAWVFIEKGAGLFEMRPVLLGDPSGIFYEIKSGIAVGERVIADNQFLRKKHIFGGKSKA